MTHTNGKPITPAEAAGYKSGILPPEVIESFNRMIAKHLCDGSATVPQDDVVQEIARTMGIDRNEVFAQKYLDVEDVFRAVGWKVKYDKPAYNESYAATFTFEAGK